MRLLLGTFIEEESFGERHDSQEELERARIPRSILERRGRSGRWRLRQASDFDEGHDFQEESRARKPRQQATINAGPYCWDKHLRRALLPRHTLSTFSKERYCNECWYLLLKRAQSSRQILGTFLKEKYSHKCWNLLLEFAQSLRLVLGSFA